MMATDREVQRGHGPFAGDLGDGDAHGVATRPASGRMEHEQRPTFRWTKPADAIIKSHRRMLERISTAVR